jgi:hypothetical protein
VKYLILIYNNPESRAAWVGLTAQQQAFGLDAYDALDKDLTASGELVASERLADPANGRRVEMRDGRAFASDGPFAETKEQLAGFYLVDCADMDRAIEIAGRIPGVPPLELEVRPVMGLKG